MFLFSKVVGQNAIQAAVANSLILSSISTFTLTTKARCTVPTGRKLALLITDQT
jgi:hypothetical protein